MLPRAELPARRSRQVRGLRCSGLRLRTDSDRRVLRPCPPAGAQNREGRVLPPARRSVRGRRVFLRAGCSGRGACRAGLRRPSQARRRRRPSFRPKASGRRSRVPPPAERPCRVRRPGPSAVRMRQDSAAPRRGGTAARWALRARLRLAVSARPRCSARPGAGRSARVRAGPCRGGRLRAGLRTREPCRARLRKASGRMRRCSAASPRGGLPLRRASGARTEAPVRRRPERAVRARRPR